MVNKVSSVESGEVIPCKSMDQVFTELEHHISLNYDEKPIIIFCVKEIKGHVEDILKNRNWLKYKEGSS